MPENFDINRWHPIEEKVALAITVTGIAVGLGSAWGVADWALHGLSFNWFLGGVCICGIVVAYVGSHWLVAWGEVRRRFVVEFRTAQAELRVWGDGATREAWAKKWFIRVLRDEAKIKATYARRVAEVEWIEFLQRNAAVGGRAILDSYELQMALLETAKRYDATISFSDYERAKLEDALRLAGMRRLGEEEINLQADELRREASGGEPWEQIL
jgi:hypothetical protein